MGRISPKRRRFTIRLRRQRREKVRKLLAKLETAQGEQREQLLAKLQRISPLHPFLLSQQAAPKDKGATSQESQQDQ